MGGDVAIIGLQASYGDIDGATRSLDEFTGSSKRADSANDQRAASSRQSATATNVSTTAVKANTMALQAQAAAARMAAYRQRNLAFQLNDVGVSLIGGMNPLMVLAQQGTQITQIYSGQGGATAALTDFANAGAKLGRLGIVAAIVGAGFVGLQNDIQATTGVAVSFGNVFKATMQELSASIMSVAGPAIAWLKEDFNKFAAAVIYDVRNVGDFLINGFEFSALAIIAIWEGLPAAMADITVRAANSIIDNIRYAINEVIILINGLIRIANEQFDTNLQGFTPFAPRGMDNPNAGAAAALGSELSEAMRAFDDSPMTEAFARIGEGAVALASAAAGAAEGISGVGSAAQATGNPMNLLGDSFNAANDNMQSWTSMVSGAMGAFNSTLQQTGSIFEAAKASGLNFLNSISQKLIEIASQNLVGAAFGGMGGGGGLFSSLLGGLGVFGSAGGGSPLSMFGPGTGIPIYHQGTDYVPNDGLAYLQQGERVVPANQITPRAGNSNISMTVNINGSLSRSEAMEITSAMAQRLREEMPGTAIEAVTEYQLAGNSV